MSIRSLMSGLKVMAGLNPPLSDNEALSNIYIPEPYKAVCLISADLEGAWAFCHSKTAINDRSRPEKLGLMTRENIPRILELCDHYKIPVTWATVGHLFLKECKQTDGIKHSEIPHIPNFINEFWEFSSGDWFDFDPGTDENRNPAWYGFSLISSIISSQVKHEIACHTFSHIDCSDTRCPNEVFKAEMNECKKQADLLGIKLSSFVHPGHQIGHLQELAECGFTSYRTDNHNYLGFPVRDKSGLWNFANTSEIALHKGWSVEFHNYYYRSIILRAIKNRRLVVLWFHPSLDKVVIDRIMQPLWSLLNEKSAEIWVTTHKEYSDYLNNIQGAKHA